MDTRVNLQLRLTGYLHEKARIIASEEERTLNAQFVYFIKKGIELYEQEHGEITTSFLSDDDDPELED